MATIYKNCRIFKSRWATNDKPYVWDELTYGQESEDSFTSVDEAKANIDVFFGNAPAPIVIDNEIRI